MGIFCILQNPLWDLTPSTDVAAGDQRFLLRGDGPFSIALWGKHRPCGRIVSAAEFYRCFSQFDAADDGGLYGDFGDGALVGQEISFLCPFAVGGADVSSLCTHLLAVSIPVETQVSRLALDCFLWNGRCVFLAVPAALHNRCNAVGTVQSLSGVGVWKFQLFWYASTGVGVSICFAVWYL